MVKKIKALVLFSGGLDSCLAAKLLKDKNYEVHALNFILPFRCGNCNLDFIKDFSKKQNLKLHVFDLRKAKLLKEYLNIIKNAKFSRGVGFNACKDCKIFMLKKAKLFSKKIKADLIVTGEVLGQRPLSQMKKDFKLIEEQTGLKSKILRPLCVKKLEETVYEKKGLVNREDFLDISGRSRKKQITLAKKYGFKNISSGGGCLLCEKFLKNRFKFLIKNNLIDSETLKIVNIGRHFFINGFWVVLGRNKKENKILERVKKEKKAKLIVPDFSGPSVFFIPCFGFKSSCSDLLIKKINILIKDYSGNNIKNRKKWEKYKI